MKNLLMILLLSLGILFGGIFVVDENEVAVINYAPNSSREYLPGIYWHLPLYGDLTYIYMNKRDTTLVIDIPGHDRESLVHGSALKVVLGWQVVNPTAYINYLKQHSRHDFDDNLGTLSGNFITQLSSATNSTVELIAAVDAATPNLVSNNLGIRVNAIKVLAVDLIATSKAANALPDYESHEMFAAESAYKLAMQIKAVADESQQSAFSQLQRQNKEFYDYLMTIKHYQNTAQDKSEVPVLSQLLK